MAERKVAISTTAPTSPSNGDGWIHTTTRIEKVWDGSVWQTILPGLTTDKIWVGNGTNKPVEGDKSGGGGVSYTELAGTDTTTASAKGATDGVWVEWDLSAIIGVGAVVVEIALRKFGATDNMGVRKKGGGLARSFSILKLATVFIQVECDASRIIEIMSGDVSDNDTFGVVGYWS